MNNLVDSFNRIHTYLRIALTDSCNFRCLYCMPDKIKCLPQKELMSPNEIFNIAKTFVEYKINKIRLTGGEPLFRRDFAEIVEKLALLPVELTLTTNGVFLDKYINLFKNHNINFINISIDTLNKDKFFTLTKSNTFTKVWNNILLAIDSNFHIKLNVVVMKDVNDNEIIDFVALTQNLQIEVRFIEFMPFSGNPWKKENVFTMKDILTLIGENFNITKIQDFQHDTSKKYKIPGYKGTFAIISTMSNPFCGGCNRMRVTADGKMKNCLFGNEEFDILTALRQNKDIKPIIEKCVLHKYQKMGGQFDNFKTLNLKKLQNRSMINIGG